MTSSGGSGARSELGGRSSRGGPAAIGVGAFLTRAIGIVLWRIAEPESLPVAPDEAAHGDPGGREVPHRATNGTPAAASRGLAVLTGGVATAAAVLGLLLIVVGGAASLTMRNLAADFAATAPGTPLTETADRLASVAKGRWWSFAYPSFQERLARAARSVREGAGALTDLVSAYDACRSEMMAAGPAGRLLRGKEQTAPVLAASARVDWPWHRGALAFREIRDAIEPYAAPNATPIARLRGTVVGAPIGHALGVAPIDGAAGNAGGAPGAEAARAGRPIEAGGRFDLPFDPELHVRLSDWTRPRPGDALLFVEQRELRLAEWPEGKIAFPREGSTFVIRLDDEWEKRAPVLPALSDAARREVGLSPAEGRTGSEPTRGR